MTTDKTPKYLRTGICTCHWANINESPKTIMMCEKHQSRQGRKYLQFHLVKKKGKNIHIYNQLITAESKRKRTPLLALKTTLYKNIMATKMALLTTAIEKKTI